MKKVVLPVFTALLSVLFLIGTTGITVIVRNCNCCGPSVETGLFEQVAPVESSCCGDMDAKPFNTAEKSLESKCCTIATESLKLDNYIYSQKITFNGGYDIQAPLTISTTYNVPTEYLKALSYHNKHGGRDLVITNCQYLI